MPKRGVNSFNDSWFTEEHFKNCLVKVSATTAKCKWCGTTLDMRNMGVASLSDHGKYFTFLNICHHQFFRESIYNGLCLTNLIERMFYIY